MKVFVAGGTGIVGRPIVSTLVAAGHEVTASTHQPAGTDLVESLGAKPALMDGRDPESVREAIGRAAPEVIVNQMTSLAAPASSYGEWLAVTNVLRHEGTAALMRAAKEAGSRRVVSQSASFMVAPTAQVADESAPLHVDAPDPVGQHIRATLAGEKQVLGTDGVEGIVLRYGFFYGDGTAVGVGGEWARAAQVAELPIVGGGAGFYPFIHVDDAVSATLRAVDFGDPGVYNIVCDEPARQSEWIPHLAGLLDAPAPPHMGPEEAAERLGVQAVYYGMQLPRVSNVKAKAQLGMILRHPSWREGFSDTFGTTGDTRLASLDPSGVAPPSRLLKTDS